MGRIRQRLASGAGWLALMSGLVSAGGCQDVDWNWDTWWWKRPQRMVRPIQTRPATPQTAVAEKRPPEAKPVPAASQPAPPAIAKREPAAPPVATRRPPPASPVPPPAAHPTGPAKVAEAPKPTPPVERTSEPTRPFYNLYLVRAGQGTRAGRNEQPIELQNAPVRGCAQLLEILYVPQFSAGSEAESYLIFEDRRTFEAAQRTVTDLDVPLWDATASAVGRPEAFAAGVGLYYQVLAGGVMIDRSIVAACERHLSDVAYSATATSSIRWIAGVLAGRLMEDFTFDYAAARGYFAQAERSSVGGSLEYLTTQWWRADTYVQEGQRDEARRVYEALLKQSGDWRETRIVQRSRSLCAELSKR